MEIKQRVTCKAENGEVIIALFFVPEGREWVVAAKTLGTSPLIDREDGVFLEVVKKKYSEERGIALFNKIVTIFKEKDLSGLRKLVLHTQRNDEFITWVMGFIPEDVAVSMKEHNKEQFAAHHAWQRGVLTEEEYQQRIGEISKKYKDE